MFRQTYKKREGGYLFFNTTGIDADTHDEVMEWCEERFGERGFIPDDDQDRWGAHTVHVGTEKIGTIWFQREDDAIEFKLRWV